MARIARVVAPGVPHHVTQRGNRRQRTFFSEEDYRAYIKLIAARCHRFSVEIWAYCFMPNHVHFIAVPETEDGLRCAFGEVHRRYTLQINRRNGWKGYLWQGRFSSFPMDETHMLAAARYIELNPVHAGLVDQPGDYQWSSAGAHLSGSGDLLIKTPKLPAMVGDWSKYLAGEIDEQKRECFRLHERTGRPIGNDEFLKFLEKESGRVFLRQKPGPKPRGA